jgi:hypothetical protein
MPGPWEDYAAQPSASAGPWDDYAKPTGPAKPPTASAKPSANDDAEPGIGAAMSDVPGSLYNIPRSMVMGPLSNVAGMASIPLHAAGLIDTPPSEVQSKVAHAGEYTPKTGVGRAIEEYNPLSLLSKGVGKVAESASGAVESSPVFRGSPIAGSLAGYATRGAIEQAPALLGAKAGAKAAEGLPARQAALDVAKGENLPRDTVRDKAQASGYITPPERGIKAAASGAAGKVKAEKIASEHNEALATRKLGAEVGVPEGSALTAEEFDRLKDSAGEDYKAMTSAVGPKLVTSPSYHAALDDSLKQIESKIEFDAQTYKDLRPAAALIRSYAKKTEMPTDKALEAIKDLRKQAKSEFVSGKDGVATARLGIANQLENVFEENLSKTGQAGLVDQFRTARERFAKIYLLDRVTNDSTGRVNLQKLASLSDTKAYKGVLTGEFKDAADLAKAYRKGTQRSTGEAPQRLTVLDGLFATYGLAGAIMGHPAALIPAAAEIGGRLAIPAMAGRGMLQNRTPSYQVGAMRRALPMGLPIGGAAVSNQIEPPPQ